MPPQTSGLLAKLAISGLYELLTLKTSEVFVDLGFKQRAILSGIGAVGAASARKTLWTYGVSKSLLNPMGFARLRGAAVLDVPKGTH